MDKKLAAKTLSFVGLTTTLNKRALDEVSAHRQERTKAAAAAPVVLAKLISTGCVPKEHEKRASDMLQSHEQTLELLKLAADKIAALEGATKTAGDIGEGVDEAHSGINAGKPSGAKYNSLTSGYVGEKTAGDEKESDRALFAGLGIARLKPKA